MVSLRFPAGNSLQRLGGSKRCVLWKFKEVILQDHQKGRLRRNVLSPFQTKGERMVLYTVRPIIEEFTSVEFSNVEKFFKNSVGW